MHLCLLCCIFAAEFRRGMKSLHQSLPLLVLLLMVVAGVTSCREATHRQAVRDALARAETLMESDPHAARAVLDSLGPHLNPPLQVFFLGSEGSRTNHAVAFQSAVNRFYNNGLYRNSSEIVYKALDPVKGLVKTIDVNTVKFLYVISTR